MPADQAYSVGKRAETLIMLRNELAGKTLLDFLVYDTKQKGRSYSVGTVMSITALDPWTVTVFRSRVEKEKSGRHCQREHIDPYRRLV